MRVLSEYQKNFLLDNFFKNEKYAGWKNIATSLLETGQCIVAGKECIWIGGVGNFIKTEEPKYDKAIDCTLYVFDLEYFLTSELYIQCRNIYTSILSNKKREIEQECDEIINLI